MAEFYTSVQAALSDDDLVHLRQDLADRVGRFRSRGVAHTARLRGADTVVVGIQPDVAFAMVQLGLSLDGVRTALDLEEGLELLRALAAKRRNHVG